MEYFTVRTVLDKMDSSDSDFRYMAASDLLSQLTNENAKIKADHELQRRLSRAVLKLLQDSNSEVQGMATKCLPPLATFVDLDNSISIVESLLKNILQNTLSKPRTSTPDMVEKKAVHDVSSLALKSILKTLTPNSTKAMKLSSTIIPSLIKSINKSTNDANTNENVLDPNIIDNYIDILEILYELLSRIGHLLTSYHIQINNVLFNFFKYKNALIKKRAISCLASLSAVCNNDIFVNIIERSLSHLQQKFSQDSLRTGVQAISALSKTSGHRLSPHLQILVPILLNHTSADENVQGDDDLREHCLQALESCCLRCRREMLPFAEKLTEASILLAKYDPNYIMDDNDEDDNMAEEEDDDNDDDYGDDYDDEDYSDDDDASWKVRHAAIACIHSMIISQMFSLSELCSKFGPFLISRFREREESVKLDVFSAFDQLLHLCSGRSIDSISYTMTNSSKSNDGMILDANNLSTTLPEIQSLANHRDTFIRGLKKELSSKSAKTKVKAMSLLRSIIISLPMLCKYTVSQVINEIKQSLADSTTGMRTETLLLLQSIVKVGGGADVLIDDIDTVIPCVLAATDDRYYKVTAECLRFCGIVVSSCEPTSQCRPKLSKLIPSMFHAGMDRVSAQDQDSEVKDAALAFLVSCITNMYEIVKKDEAKNLIRVLISRLKNPGTQVSTLKHLQAILLNEHSSVYIKDEMNEIAPVIYSFLKKSDIALRRSAVELLTLIPTIPVLENNNDSILIENVSQLINDKDLRITSMALDVAIKIIQTRGIGVIPLIIKPNSIYHKTLILTKSSLLQGRVIDSLLKLYSNLAKAHSNELSIEQILQALELQAENVSFGINTSSVYSSPLYCIGKCIVAVCREAETDLRIDTTKRIIDNINSSDFKTRIFALACLAEFGRGSLLPKEGNEKETVRLAVLEALEAPVDEVKTAAAIALGGLASSDAASGVPSLISLIKERSHQRYLLLLSLKESISSVKQADLEPMVPMILPLLLDQSAHSPTIAHDVNNVTSGIGNNNTNNGTRGRFSEEESVRTATAECLGLLADTCPGVVIEQLKLAASSTNVEVRAAVVSGIRFAISWSMMSGEPPSTELRNNIDIFMNMIGDEDVMVSKNAIQAVNAVAKSYPNLLVNHLPKALPLIYARTVKNKNLIRVVDLGPFKHEEDYGLDLRKCAFDCLRTFISGPLRSSIHLVGLLEHVVVGLRDQTDVRAIAQLIVMAAASGENANQMVNVMDTLVNALDATLNERIKENAVRQEVERYEESIRGALRAIRAMENVSEIAACVSFQTLLNTVVRTPKLLDRYETIAQQEVNLLSINKTGGNSGNTTNERNTRGIDADDSMSD